MIHIQINSDTRYPVNRKIIRKAIGDIFKKNKMESLEAEISIAVVGSRKMKLLTDKFKKDNKDHQILTFPFEDVFHKSASKISSQGFVNPPNDILQLGDIVLCWPIVLEEASKDDIMVDEEVYKLICHGAEHLLGKKHE